MSGVRSGLEKGVPEALFLPVVPSLTCACSRTCHHVTKLADFVESYSVSKSFMNVSGIIGIAGLSEFVCRSATYIALLSFSEIG